MIKKIILLVLKIAVVTIIVFAVWVDRSDFTIKVILSWLVLIVFGILSWMRKQKIKQDFHEVDTVYRLKQMGKEKAEK